MEVVVSKVNDFLLLLSRAIKNEINDAKMMP